MVSKHRCPKKDALLYWAESVEICWATQFYSLFLLVHGTGFLHLGADTDGTGVQHLSKVRNGAGVLHLGADTDGTGVPHLSEVGIVQGFQTLVKLDMEQRFYTLVQIQMGLGFHTIVK